LNLYHFRNPSAVREFFFSALNFFVITFALVVVWTYVGLARRRLSPSVPLAGGR
jgi:membrane protease YdiL (CAAX protease family)